MINYARLVGVRWLTLGIIVHLTSTIGGVLGSIDQVKGKQGAANAVLQPNSVDQSESPDDGIERFYFEHMIGEKDAARSFVELADELINKQKPAWCPDCGKSIVRYCLDNRMLHDHCCCDAGHARDALPWLPHSCYVGENCEPNMQSCMRYTEIRECCCDRIMAKQWRDIRSTASRHAVDLWRNVVIGSIATGTMLRRLLRRT